MQTVQGVVAHKREVIQVQDAGIAEVPEWIARDDPLLFPCLPLIPADDGGEGRANVVLVSICPVVHAQLDEVRLLGFYALLQHADVVVTTMPGMTVIMGQYQRAPSRSISSYAA